MSGGQQQRVALARALAIEPGIVLLDEPFSALDKNLRLDMQIEIKSLLTGYGVTSIIVTHDQEEALSMADRIVVLNRGRVEQIGTPDALYDRPSSLFVNQFIGHANFLRGRLIAADRVRLDAGAEIALSNPSAIAVGSAVTVSVRPENITITDPGGAGSLAGDGAHHAAAGRRRRHRSRFEQWSDHQDPPAALAGVQADRGGHAARPRHHRPDRHRTVRRDCTFTGLGIGGLTMFQLTRRSLLGSTSALLAAGALGGLVRPAHAAGSIVATTYPGSFDEAFKAVVGPALAKNSGGGSVTFSPLLNVDQIGKIQASRNAPPFDVVLFDEGPLIPAIEAGILEKFPADQVEDLRRYPGSLPASRRLRAGDHGAADRHCL